MKKFALLLASLLALSLILTGCDEKPGDSSSISSSPSPSETSPSSSQPASTSPSPAANDLNSILSQGEYVEGAGGDGYLGDVMHTYWFNFMIDEAYTCDTYGDYTAPEGYKLLVVHIAMKNTYRSSTTMYDSDFPCLWDDDADDAYAYALTTEPYWSDQVAIDHQLTDEQLPAEFDLPINGVEDGELVYQVPTNLPDGRENKDFFIFFDESAANDNLDDMYVIYFTAEAR